MAALKDFITVATITLMVIQSAMATDITVGAPGGTWDLNTDYATWAKAQTFVVGDKLIFSYVPSHDVLEVKKADYDSCATNNPINMTYHTGNDAIPLTDSTTRYFICGTAGHCGRGMKVTIDVGASATPTPPSSPGSSPAPPTSTSPPPPPPLSPNGSGANGHSVQAKAAAGFGLGMLVFWAL